MNYNEFLHTIRTELKQHILPSAKIIIRKIPQNNGAEKDALAILPKGKDISPSLYMEPYYEQYQKGTPLSEILEDILEVYQIHMTESPFDIASFHDFETVRPNLAYQLVHYERNFPMLDRVPHKPFLDLAVICYFMVEDPSIGCGTVPVYKEHLSLWNITEEELFAIAEENTPALLPPVFRPMDDMMKELLCADLTSEASDEWTCTQGTEALTQETELLLSGIRGSEEATSLYVVSNCLWKFGASVILYPGLLADFAKRFGSDYYILPCSIHEVIFVPADQKTTPEALTKIIQTINAADVSIPEQLSDHVYYYHAQTGKLE